MKASSMQKPVVNLLQKFDMDSSIAWGNAASGSTNYSITHKTDQGHLGKNCYQIVRNDANGISAISQTVTLSQGTYTLSAYLKSENIGDANDAEIALVFGSLRRTAPEKQ